MTMQAKSTLQNAKFNVMCNNFWKKQTISFCEPAKNFALINLSGTFILQTQSLSFLGFNFGKLLFCQAEQNNQHQIMQKKQDKLQRKVQSFPNYILLFFWSLVLQISCNFVCIWFFTISLSTLNFQSRLIFFYLQLTFIRTYVGLLKKPEKPSWKNSYQERTFISTSCHSYHHPL